MECDRGIGLRTGSRPIVDVLPFPDIPIPTGYMSLPALTSSWFPPIRLETERAMISDSHQKIGQWLRHSDTETAYANERFRRAAFLLDAWREVPSAMLEEVLSDERSHPEFPSERYYRGVAKRSGFIVKVATTQDKRGYRHRLLLMRRPNGGGHAIGAIALEYPLALTLL